MIFHLTRPTPDFLNRAGAAREPSPFRRTPPVDLPVGAVLPATGPYQIRSQIRLSNATSGHPRLELVRNPHFRVWSPAAQHDGYPERVVLETGYTDNQAVERVTTDAADLLWFGATLTDLDKLRTRHGSQLHTTPRPVTNMLFLNTTTPPFDNRDARRAVAYGLDRAALTSRGDVPSPARSPASSSTKTSLATSPTARTPKPVEQGRTVVRTRPHDGQEPRPKIRNRRR